MRFSLKIPYWAHPAPSSPLHRQPVWMCFLLSCHMLVTVPQELFKFSILCTALQMYSYVPESSAITSETRLEIDCSLSFLRPPAPPAQGL